MSILFNNHGGESSAWIDALSEQLPDMTIFQYPNQPSNNDIEYAVVWAHPQGDLANYPKLKAIFNLGAGADWLEADTNLPPVPVVRLLDPSVGVNMSQYVLYWVMHNHRGYGVYQHQQSHQQWSRFQVVNAEDYCVTVLGLGLIGECIAKTLSANSYRTQGWNRSPKTVTNVKCFSGVDGLHKALAKTDVLVNCLPHNEATEQLINADLINALPKGAHLINVSRGGVVDHNAVLDALSKQHLSSATLDTFSEEPLVKNSPLWHHPKVRITPHMSGATYPNTSAKVIADNIKRMDQGQLPFPIYKQFSY